MSDFMKNVNHDLPVEEGFISWIKQKFGKKEEKSASSNKEVKTGKTVVIDKKEFDIIVRKFETVIKSVLNKSEFKELKPGFKKLSMDDCYVEDTSYHAFDVAGGIEDFIGSPVNDIIWWVSCFQVDYDKIFKGKEYLDMSPEAERGDLSAEGKQFWKLIDAFEKALNAEVQKKIPALHGAKMLSINDWDDDPEVYIAMVVKPSDIPSKEAAKEATQEALFQDLTGQPVKEMSDNAAEALAVASAIGLVGLGMGLFSLVNKGIDKLFGNKKSSSSSTKINRQSAAKLKQLGQQFMATQNIDANERRSAFNDAIRLLKQYYPKEYIKQHFNISLIGGEWNEPSDFYKGKINICDFAFIHSASQEIPGYEEIRKKHLPEDEEDEQREAAKNKYHKTIHEMLNSINKDLAKKYKGKYRVYCEEFDDYWDIYGEGDGDEGVLIIADVDIISRMKSYVKNHAVEESFTEIDINEDPVEESLSLSTAGRAILGIISTLGIGYGIKKFMDHKKAKKEEEKPAPGFNEDEFLSNNPVDTEEREAVYKGATAIVKKVFGKHIQYVGSKNFDPNIFIGKAKPKTNDIFVIDLCRIFDFVEIPEVIKAFNTLTDDTEKQAFIKKEFPKWDREIHKLLSKAQNEIQKKFGTKYELEFGSVDDWCVLCMIDTAYVTKFSSASRVARESTIVTEGIGSAIGALGLIGLGALVGKKILSKSKNDQQAEEQTEKLRVKYKAWLEENRANPKERAKVFADAKKMLRNIDKENVEAASDRVSWMESRFLDGSSEIIAIGYIDPGKFKEIDMIIKTFNRELVKKYGRKFFAICNGTGPSGEAKMIEDICEEYWKVEPGTVLLIDKDFKTKLDKHLSGSHVAESFIPTDGYSAVTEGWGVVMTRFAVKHNLPFAKKLEDKIWQWSETTVNKLISLPEFKSYIDREASTVFKEEVKKNKNLSLKITPDMIEKFEETYADEAQFKKTESRNCCFCQKVGLYYIGVFGDKSHIHGVWLLMSDVRNRKIFAKALPAPSEEEMKKLCFQG